MFIIVEPASESIKFKTNGVNFDTIEGSKPRAENCSCTVAFEVIEDNKLLVDESPPIKDDNSGTFFVNELTLSLLILEDALPKSAAIPPDACVFVTPKDDDIVSTKELLFVSLLVMLFAIEPKSKAYTFDISNKLNIIKINFLIYFFLL